MKIIFIYIFFNSANGTWVRDAYLSNCSATCGEGNRTVRQVCTNVTCGGSHVLCGEVGVNRTINETCEIYLDPVEKSCYREKIFFCFSSKINIIFKSEFRDNESFAGFAIFPFADYVYYFQRKHSPNRPKILFKQTHFYQF